MDRNESIRISMHYKQLFISTNNYHLRLNIPRTVYHPHSLSLSLSSCTFVRKWEEIENNSSVHLFSIFFMFFFNNSRQQLRLILKDGERRRKKLKDATKVSHSSSSSATYTDTPLFSFSSCS